MALGISGRVRWVFLLVGSLAISAGLYVAQAEGVGAQEVLSEPLALSLIIDNSGSTQGLRGGVPSDPDGLRWFSVRYTVARMDDDDELSIIKFHSVADGVGPFEVGQNRGALLEAGRDRPAEGNTDFLRALELAYSHLDQATASSRAAVLLSDGEPHPDGWPGMTTVEQQAYVDQVLKQARKFAERGWPVFTVSFAWPLNVEVLKSVAEITGGEYFKAPTSELVPPTIAGILNRLRQEIRVLTCDAELLETDGTWHRYRLDIGDNVGLMVVVADKTQAAALVLRDTDGNLVPSEKANWTTTANGLNEVYRIRGPDSGDWSLEGYTERLRLDCISSGVLKLEQPTDEGFTANASIPVRVHFEIEGAGAEQPVKTSVALRVRSLPNGEWVTISLNETVEGVFVGEVPCGVAPRSGEYEFEARLDDFRFDVPRVSEIREARDPELDDLAIEVQVPKDRFTAGVDGSVQVLGEVSAAGVDNWCGGSPLAGETGEMWIVDSVGTRIQQSFVVPKSGPFQAELDTTGLAVGPAHITVEVAGREQVIEGNLARDIVSVTLAFVAPDSSYARLVANGLDKRLTVVLSPSSMLDGRGDLEFGVDSLLVNISSAEGGLPFGCSEVQLHRSGSGFVGALPGACAGNESTLTLSIAEPVPFPQHVNATVGGALTVDLVPVPLARLVIDDPAEGRSYRAGGERITLQVALARSEFLDVSEWPALADTEVVAQITYLESGDVDTVRLGAVADTKTRVLFEGTFQMVPKDIPGGGALVEVTARLPDQAPEDLAVSVNLEIAPFECPPPSFELVEPQDRTGLMAEDETHILALLGVPNDEEGCLVGDANIEFTVEDSLGNRSTYLLAPSGNQLWGGMIPGDVLSHGTSSIVASAELASGVRVEPIRMELVFLKSRPPDPWFSWLGMFVAVSTAVMLLAVGIYSRLVRPVFDRNLRLLIDQHPRNLRRIQSRGLLSGLFRREIWLGRSQDDIDLLQQRRLFRVTPGGRDAVSISSFNIDENRWGEPGNLSTGRLHVHGFSIELARSATISGSSWASLLIPTLALIAILFAAAWMHSSVGVLRPMFPEELTLLVDRDEFDLREIQSSGGVAGVSLQRTVTVGASNDDIDLNDVGRLFKIQASASDSVSVSWVDAESESGWSEWGELPVGTSFERFGHELALTTRPQQ